MYNLKIIYYGGDEKILNDVIHYEARWNHCDSWIDVKFKDGTSNIYHGICVIKSLEEEKIGLFRKIKAFLWGIKENDNKTWGMCCNYEQAVKCAEEHHAKRNKWRQK